MATPLVRVIAFALGAAWATASPAMTVQPMSLSAIAAEASRVVHGTVEAADPGRDEHGLPATWVTLRVTEALKGDAPARFTFKQLGASGPLPDGALGRIAGLPSYRPGAEVVLFLRDASALGFASPVGLGQGVYWVDRGGPVPLARAALGRAKAERLDVLLDTARHGGWTR